MIEESASFHTRTQLPYVLLLEKEEWLKKREHILQRDEYKCRQCGKGEDQTELHVHHKRYIEGHDPWEYNDSDLVTLCEHCHREYHRLHSVPYYIEEDGTLFLIHREPCKRCGGAGYFPEYRHVIDGLCFRCRGERYEESISLVERYEMETGISLDEHFPGYSPLTDSVMSEWIGVDTKIVFARVSQPQFPNSRKRVHIVLKGGRVVYSLLDFSHYAEPGDYLDVDTLIYRPYRNIPVVRDRFVPLDDISISRIVERFTGKKQVYHITGANLQYDSEYGPEGLEVKIETSSGDTITMTPYSTSEDRAGTKLDVSSLMYCVKKGHHGRGH